MVEDCAASSLAPACSILRRHSPNNRAELSLEPVALMDAGTSPVATDVVLVGAGHAHVGVLRSVRHATDAGRAADADHAAGPHALFRHAAGHDRRPLHVDQAHIDTGPLARFAGARLYQAEAIGLDLGGRRVLCADRPPIPYDLLSLDIGSMPGGAEVPGVAEHAMPVKPIDGSSHRFEAARARILAARGRARIGVVGGGACRRRAALALQAGCRVRSPQRGPIPRVARGAAVRSSPTSLPTLPSSGPPAARADSAERGVEVLTEARVVGMEAGACRHRRPCAARLRQGLLGDAGRAAPWLSETGLALDERGFIAVDATLQTCHTRTFSRPATRRP